MPGIISPYGFSYETVAVGQTAQVMGGVGAKGDYLHRILINTITVATADVSIIDGATGIVVQAGAATLVLGPNILDIGVNSVNGPWAITTGAGATVIGIGIFSA